MEDFRRSHLSDGILLSNLARHVAEERGCTAIVLADIGEVDGRRLYRESGYPSMFEYCVGELKLSESSAYRRIQVARECRKYPRLFHAIADGRLNLTTVLLLRPHLREENVDEWIQAATHRRKPEIQRLIAERFGAELAPELVGKATLTETAPGIFEMRVVVGSATVEKVRKAQDLMSHRNPTRNLAVVLDRVLDLAIAQLEKQKFGATAHPQAARPTAPDSRHIPAEVRRAVYARDGGQCVFVSARGKRCESRHQLEFDHEVPIAQGGTSTVGNLRLLCRAHNQLAAIDVFGLAFMGHRIEEAQVARAAPRDTTPLPRGDQLAPERVPPPETPPQPAVP